MKIIVSKDQDSEYSQSTYLEVLDDDRVVAVLALDHLLEVLAHFLELAGKCAQTVHLSDDVLGELTLGSILDITHQVLHADLFLRRSLNSRRHMDELATDVAVVVDLLLREVCFGGQADLRLLVHANDAEDGRRIIAAHHLVDVNIVLADGGAGRVPADDLLLAVDLSEHGIHGLVEDVIEEPNVRRIFLVFFEGHSVTVGDLARGFPVELLLVVTQQDTDDSSLGVLGDAIVVIDDGQEHCRMHDNNVGMRSLHSLNGSICH